MSNKLKLQTDYVVNSFYRYGYKVEHNKNHTIYCCSCPICHEGHSFGKKKRCYLFIREEYIYCHNCGRAYDLAEWIMLASGMTKEQLLSDIKDGGHDYIDLDKPEIIITENQECDCDNILPIDCINLFDNQQVSSYKNNPVVVKALSYISARRLDKALNKPKGIYLSLNDEREAGRLILPAYDETGKLIWYQSRSIDAGLNTKMDKVRYSSMSGHERTMFGVENISPSINNAYLFEGPIDSYFVKNGLGVAGINLGRKNNFSQTQIQQLKGVNWMHDIVWCIDSQWADETSKKKTLSLLESGERVFLWPKDVGSQYKDLNEMCVSRGLNGIDYSFIDDNIIYGKIGIAKYKLIMSL